MKHRYRLYLAGVVLLGAALVPLLQPSFAQPARGAVAAFDRVKEVINSRFKDMKLIGDPDQDFAMMLIAHHEDLIFLAKTQLEFGADQGLRQLAQKILVEQEAQIDQTKRWQAGRKEPSYRAQPDQPLHGTGPLDRPVSVSEATRTAQAAPLASSASSKPSAASDLPLVSGTIEKIDAAAGRLTIEHGPIPNLNMDGMTMVFRVQDPAMLKSFKPGARVRFTADRVQGQITITRIEAR
jgi:Cu/Ag efflux protein CusF